MKLQSSAQKTVFFIIAFVLPAIYWIYLLFNSRMDISCDAIGYESLGRILHQGGWIEYFRQGPGREPFYPLTVAVSMTLAKILSVNYQFIQALFQIIILLITQLLTLRILNKLKINRLIAALTVLYLGISPAIVNSTFSLYSEILTYPFVLLLMMLLIDVWPNMARFSVPRTVWLGILAGICGLFLMFIKGIFEIVFPLLILPAFLAVLWALRRKNNKMAINCLLFLTTALLVFEIPVFLYKDQNRKYNGTFTFTDRGAWALYGNTARRVEPMTPGRLVAAAAYVTGDGACQRFCSKEDCYFWSFFKSDEFAFDRRRDLKGLGYSGSRLDNQLLRESVDKALRRLPQYFLFAGLEAFKMFFWESTKIGFVSYPENIGRLFAWGPFKDGIRILLTGLTMWGFFYSAMFLWKKRSCIADSKNKQDQERFIILLPMFVLILLFAAVHSIFYVLPRYAFPMVPLFLIFIANHLSPN